MNRRKFNRSSREIYQIEQSQYFDQQIPYLIRSPSPDGWLFTLQQNSLGHIQELSTIINQDPFIEPSDSSQQSYINSRDQKNICMYIQRKILRCLVSTKYQKIVRKICFRYRCDYQLVINYYNHHQKAIFGISHLILMIHPQKDEEKQIKQVFVDFLQYFLRNKYNIYMLKQGKMENKDIYFKVKNRLLYLSSTIPKYKPSNQNIGQATTSNSINDYGNREYQYGWGI